MSHPFQEGVGGRDESLDLVFLPAYQSMLTSSMTGLDVAVRFRVGGGGHMWVLSQSQPRLKRGGSGHCQH